MSSTGGPLPAVLKALSVSARHLAFRRFARWTLRALFRLATRLEISGLADVPARGPLVVAFNHLGYSDPVLMIAYLPECPEIIGLADLLEIRGLGAAMRAYGAIPIHRDQFDRAVVERALRVLESGKMLAMAPEARMTRSGALERARLGAAYLAAKANAPVLPVALAGTENEAIFRAWRAGRRPKLTVAFGRPFRLGDVPLAGPGRRDALREAADEIMRRIADMLPARYRGVYAQGGLPHIPKDTVR